MSQVQNLKKSSMTPYEIRLELLKLSFSILTNSGHRSPSVTEVIDRARELNGFVCEDKR